MRIAQVSLQYGATVTGGGGVHVEKIVEYLRKLDHQVTVLSIHTAPTMAAKPQIDPDERFSAEGEGPTVVRFATDLPGEKAEELQDAYVGDKHTELNRILRFCELATAWLKKHIDEFDVVHCHGHHAVTGWIAKELKDAPCQVVSTIHYLESTNITATKGGLMHYKIQPDDLARMKDWEAMARFANYPVVISPGQQVDFLALLEELGHDAKEAKPRLRLVSSGIDPDSVMSRDKMEAKVAEPADPVRIVSFARLDPVKGFEYAIHGAIAAADKVSRKFELVVAGVPEEEVYIPVLEKAIAEANKKFKAELRIFDGIFSPAERDAFLDDFDLYLFPTLREPFGITVIEVGARGLGLVTTDSPGPLYILGPAEITEHDWGLASDYGLLIKRTDDPEANLTANVARGLVEALNDWPKTAQRALDFHGYLSKRWTWPGVVNEYLALYGGEAGGK